LRVLVCGGRDYARRPQLERVLTDFHETHRFTMLIHGGARGADTMAGEWAVGKDIPVRVFHALWHKHGNAAGPIRNAQMLTEGRPDLVIAFPGGSGTASMVGLARQAGVEVQIIE
jgi:YspA, cpYpsA-related SLOG family